MNFKVNESATKLRGGYYTPPAVARFLSKWVLKNRPQTVLEPGCGDGAFVRAFLGLHQHRLRFTGIEVLDEEAIKAVESASADQLLDSQIINTDFLEWSLAQIDANAKFDAVVGNPPYIRYQYLEDEDQRFSELVFSKYHLPFTKHTNAWVPFVIASIGLLAPAGRLAMVIPSELLHVLHAGSLRKFLLTECSRILLIDPRELLFKQALQGVVLLMVEKKCDPNRHSDGVAIVSLPDDQFLENDPEPFFENANYISGDVLNDKWMKFLLNPNELQLIEKLRTFPAIRRFGDIASVDIGIVTGANKFFLVDNVTVSEYGLENFAFPMFGRSGHCPGVIYDQSLHLANALNGLPINFLWFDNTNFEDLPEGAQEYIRLGESQNLHTRYKCRIREPWYSVPSVYATEVSLLKRSHHYPRLILNTAGAFTTDTAYRIRSLGIPGAKLVFSFINSLTALTSELEGRHYGGGVLELVPSEIEKILVPVPAHVEDNLSELDTKIRQKVEADTVLFEQDNLVLRSVGLTKSECVVIHEAWRRIINRRQRLVDDDVDNTYKE